MESVHPRDLLGLQRGGDGGPLASAEAAANSALQRPRGHVFAVQDEPIRATTGFPRGPDTFLRMGLPTRLHRRQRLADDRSQRE